MTERGPIWPLIVTAHQLAGPLGGMFVEPKGLLVAAMVHAFGDDPEWSEVPAVAEALEELHVPREWIDFALDWTPHRVGAVMPDSSWLLNQVHESITEGGDTSPRAILVAFCEALRDKRKGRKIVAYLELRPGTLDGLIEAAGA